MQGFTRVVYENGYKTTMLYPPGWTAGDPREPRTRTERYLPASADASMDDADPLTYIWCNNPDREDEQESWSYPLKTYLNQLWMPQFKADAQVLTHVRTEWPRRRGLMSSTPRELYAVQRIMGLDLRHAFAVLKAKLSDAQITVTAVDKDELGDLMLPDTTCCEIVYADACVIDSSPVSAPSHLTKILRVFLMRTIFKVMRLFLHISDDRPIAAMFRFDDVNHFCPFRSAGMFDLVALPGSLTCADELALLMVVVTPWDVIEEDLEEFARVGTPDPEAINLANRASMTRANMLRAMIWDVCKKHNCRFFVVTTYDLWVFGTLSADMHCSRMTPPLRAPVFPYDMDVKRSDIEQACFPVPSVFECLVLWIFAAADFNHTCWRLPPNMLAPPRTSGSGAPPNDLVAFPDV